MPTENIPESTSPLPEARHYTIWFLLIALALAIDTLLLFRSMDALTESRRLVRESYEVSEQTIGLMSSINHVILRQRRYIVTGEPDLLRTFDLSATLARNAIEQTGQRVRGNPAQVKNFEQLHRDFDAIVSAARHEMDLFRNSGLEAVRLEMAKGTTAARMSEAWRTLQWIQQEERRQLEDRVGRADRDSRTVLLTFSVAAAGILCMLVWAYLLIQRDIRRTREQTGLLETRVAQRTAQLQATNRELEAFCYSVSHDLRAPLRSISGFSEALLEDNDKNLDDSGRDYLQRIVAASARMGLLIDDLLDLSRVTRGEIDHEPVDLTALARRMATELSRNGHAAASSIHIDEGLHATGDPRLLGIMLTNLFENALKYTGPRPQPRIEFLSLTPENQGRVFAVRDNGVGFDMAYADKLFTPFQRLHTSDEFAGTGIGLAIVQRIVARHGGRVWAEAAVDRGATIYFTL